VTIGESGEPAITHNENRFYTLGDPVHTGVLFKVDHVLVTKLAFTRAGGTAFGTLTATSTENGIRLEGGGFEGAAQLRVFVTSEQMAGGLATIGEGGYTVRSSDFETEGVTDVLIGSGVDLVRLRLDEPSQVSGQSVDSGFALRIAVANKAAELQVKFREERARAVTLAGQAADAEGQGELGQCLRLWQELLDGFPYEAELVARAEETRGRLIRTGFDELRALEERVERARFFRLADLFRQCKDSANEIAQRYAGSEVETKAQEVIAAIDAELATLEADLDQQEVERLKSIQRVLEAQGANELAAKVRSYLDQHFGGGR